MKRSKVDSSVLFIDASDQFKRLGNKNKLLPEHQDRIVDLYRNREDVAHVSKLVTVDEILENDANLSVTSYVEPEDTREIIDIKALNAKIAQIVVRQEELRREIDAIVAELEGQADSDEASLEDEDGGELL